jgi:hypothetical protein
MAVSDAHGCRGAEPVDEAAGWAISVIRRSLHGARDCKTPVTQNLRAFLTDIEAVGALFRNAQEAMLRLQSAGLVVAPSGTIAMTRDERRLLRATAAAQAEDDTLLDHRLFKLAPHPRARPPLIKAVTALATTLGASGHWLIPLALPATALRVAQLRGLDLGTISVDWPRCAKGNDADL